MKPVSSLFTKILSWFFLNLILVITALAIFFIFQPQVNLHSIFGKQVSNRLSTAGMLITHDLNRALEANWPDILARHAKIHQVDFALVLEDGRCISSTGRADAVITRARGILQRPLTLGGSRRPLCSTRHKGTRETTRLMTTVTF